MRFRKSKSIVSSVLIAAGAMLLAGIAETAVRMPTANAQSPSVDTRARAMLQDALDALSDNRPDQAERLFEMVIETFPRTVDAGRARSELQRLRGDSVEGESTVTPSEAKPSDRAVIDSDRSRKAQSKFVRDVGDRVFFAETSAIIGGRARSLIEAQVRWLKRAPEIAVTLVGRADDQIDQAGSVDLSRSRAEAVRAKMIEAGLPASRISITAAGARDRIAICDGALCRAQNRIVETVIGVPKDGGDLSSAQEDSAGASDPYSRLAR